MSIYIYIFPNLNLNRNSMDIPINSTPLKSSWSSTVAWAPATTATATAPRSARSMAAWIQTTEKNRGLWLDNSFIIYNPIMYSN